MSNQNIVGSNEPSFASDSQASNRGYGQNGYTGPPSDTPGKNTKSGFLPGPGAPVNDQLRKVKADPITPAYGMKKQGA